MEKREDVEDGICIVSFDGGGPGSMSQLRMLEEFMLRLAFETDVEVDELRPADYFDLMAGVGFGGFVALLLGRLRMTTSQAMEELTTVGFETFPKGDERTITEVTMARLRTAIESMLERNEHSVGMKLRDTSDSRCKVVLFAAATEVMDHCHPFRTYRSPRKCLECTFVDAACATMAIPGYFPSVSIGPRLRKQNFAGIPHNFHNPTREVLKEARLVFGEKTPVSLMLSLGAGQSARHSSPDHQVTRWSRIHYDGVARDLQDQLHGFAEYLRLNVDKGMESIELDNWHELGLIETYTNAYLEMNQITRYIDRAVQLLLQRNGSVTLGNMSGTSADYAVKFHSESLEKYLAMEFKQMGDVIRGLGIEKVTLVDAIGNDIPIPKHFCPTYAMLLDVIKVYFRHQRPPGSDFVERGDYRLLQGSSRGIIDPVEWDQIENVKLKVEMSMILRTRNGDKARCPRCRTRSEAPPTNGWATCVSCSGQFEIEDQLVEYEVESGDDSHNDEAHAEENRIVTPGVRESVQTSRGRPPTEGNKKIAKEEELKFRLISVVNILDTLRDNSLASAGLLSTDPLTHNSAPPSELDLLETFGLGPSSDVNFTQTSALAGLNPPQSENPIATPLPQSHTLVPGRAVPTPSPSIYRDRDSEEEFERYMGRQRAQQGEAGRPHNKPGFLSRLTATLLGDPSQPVINLSSHPLAYQEGKSTPDGLRLDTSISPSPSPSPSPLPSPGRRSAHISAPIPTSAPVWPPPPSPRHPRPAFQDVFVPSLDAKGKISLPPPHEMEGSAMESAINLTQSQNPSRNPSPTPSNQINQRSKSRPRSVFVDVPQNGLLRPEDIRVGPSVSGTPVSEMDNASKMRGRRGTATSRNSGRTSPDGMFIQSNRAGRGGDGLDVYVTYPAATQSAANLGKIEEERNRQSGGHNSSPSPNFRQPYSDNSFREHDDGREPWDPTSRYPPPPPSIRSQAASYASPPPPPVRSPRTSAYPWPNRPVPTKITMPALLRAQTPPPSYAPPPPPPVKSPRTSAYPWPNRPVPSKITMPALLRAQTPPPSSHGGIAGIGAGVDYHERVTSASALSPGPGPPHHNFASPIEPASARLSIAGSFVDSDSGRPPIAPKPQPPSRRNPIILDDPLPEGTPYRHPGHAATRSWSGEKQQISRNVSSRPPGDSAVVRGPDFMGVQALITVEEHRSPYMQGPEEGRRSSGSLISVHSDRIRYDPAYAIEYDLTEALEKEVGQPRVFSDEGPPKVARASVGKRVSKVLNFSGNRWK